MQFNEQAFIRLYQQASIKTIESSNFYIGVSLGVIPNYSKAFIFGKKQGMSAGEEDVFNVPGNYQFLTSSSFLQVRSTSPNDNITGTGARTLMINGLDASYAEISESIILNGTASATTTKQFLRVNQIFVQNVGSNETNVGEIDLFTGSNILARILVKQGQSHLGVYTVPASKTGFVIRMGASLGRDNGANAEKDCTVEMRRKVIGQSWRLINGFYLNNRGNGNLNKDLNFGVRLNEKTDVKFICRTLENNVSIICEAEILLINTINQ